MKILIVKLGAMGDVLRTTPLLTSFKRLDPTCHITWVVEKSSSAVLRNNPRIDSLLTYSAETVKALGGDTFDLAVNLDKEDEALDTIMACRAATKRGFGRSADGKLVPLDADSDYAYRLGVDDELKFRQNKKTYQEISFEQLGLRFKGEEYIFPVENSDKQFAAAHLKNLGVAVGSDRPKVGLNTGSGPRFAGKKLPAASYARLAEKIYAHTGHPALLLGGDTEAERNLEIETLSKAPVVNTGSHSIGKFAAIISACDVVISGDTIAMHVAIAMKVPVVAFFASTCAAEIELYGRGKKIVSPIICAPCYKRICPIDEQCMKDMTVDEIFDAARLLIKDRILS